MVNCLCQHEDLVCSDFAVAAFFAGEGCKIIFAIFDTFFDCFYFFVVKLLAELLHVNIAFSELRESGKSPRLITKFYAVK